MRVLSFVFLLLPATFPTAIRNGNIKKLGFHILPLLSPEAKKLRLCQAQAKKLVNKLSLRLLPYDSCFL